jgi:ABC-type branched-subunit amino acid transport system permease subunit
MVCPCEEGFRSLFAPASSLLKLKNISNIPLLLKKIFNIPPLVEEYLQHRIVLMNIYGVEAISFYFLVGFTSLFTLTP